jgi:hypothetical protein
MTVLRRTRINLVTVTISFPGALFIMQIDVRGRWTSEPYTAAWPYMCRQRTQCTDPIVFIGYKFVPYFSCTTVFKQTTPSAMQHRILAR